MITLALTVSDERTALRATLASLAAQRPADFPVVFISSDRDSGQHDLLQTFVRRHGGRIMTTDGPLSPADTTAMARGQTGLPYVVGLAPGDLLYRPGLEALHRKLANTRPDVVVLGSGWGHPGSGTPIPGPDAERAAHLSDHPDPAELRSLYPMAGRVLLRDGHFAPRTAQATEMSEAADVAAIAALWTHWEQVLGEQVLGEPAFAGQTPSLPLTPERLLFSPLPLLLPPLPSQGAARTLAAVTRRLAGVAKPDRAARLERDLIRAGDALRLSPAAAAQDTLEAAHQLLASLPRGLRRQACAAPAPVGPLLNAVRRSRPDAALAQLALLANARTDQQIAALADGFTALRQDLDLALPGSDYLMDLYMRLRGI